MVTGRVYLDRQRIRGALPLIIAIGFTACVGRTPAAGTNLQIPRAGEVEVSAQQPTSKDFISLREIGDVMGRGLAVSPNERFVAFELHQADLDRNSYDVAWFVAPLEARGPAVNVGDGGDPLLFRGHDQSQQIVGSWRTSFEPLWSEDSRWIVYPRLHGGEVQLWRSLASGGRQEQLTRNDADVQTLLWSEDHSVIFFTTDAPRSQLQAARAVEEDTGFLFDYNRSWDAFRGRPYREPYSLTGGEAIVWVLDWQSGTERRAEPSEIAEYEALVGDRTEAVGRPNVRSVARSAVTGSRAWFSAEDPAKQGTHPPLTLFAEQPSKQGVAVLRCELPECTGIIDLNRPVKGGVWWGNDDQSVYYVRREGVAYSQRVIYEWKVERDTVREVLRLEDANAVTDCTPVDGGLICFLQTPIYPRTIVAIDLADGSMETLVDPNPDFARFRLGEPRKLEWKNELGHESFGYLILPVDYETGRRYPLAITGYRARDAFRGGTGGEFPVHQLAAQGIAVVVYERHENWELKATEPDYYEQAVVDWGPEKFDYVVPMSSFETVIEMLDREGLIDPGRVGGDGFSNGAGHINYALIHSSLFSVASVAWSQTGPSAYFLSGVARSFRQKIQNRTGRGRPGTKYGWAWPATSLALNAARVNTPLLINVSDKEHAPTLENVITLMEEGKPVEMHVFPGEYHMKWYPLHRLATLQRNLAWYRFWLQAKEDIEPVDPDQYVRWRRLRDQHIANLTAAGKVYPLPLP